MELLQIALDRLPVNPWLPVILLYMIGSCAFVCLWILLKEREPLIYDNEADLETNQESDQNPCESE